MICLLGLTQSKALVRGSLVAAPLILRSVVGKAVNMAVTPRRNRMVGQDCWRAGRRNARPNRKGKPKMWLVVCCDEGITIP
jgi:hypothetical protein